MYLLKIDLKLSLDENDVNSIPQKVEVLKKFQSPSNSNMIECNRVVISKDLQQVAAVYSITG
jgi:hypothetical protein